MHWTQCKQRNMHLDTANVVEHVCAGCLLAPTLELQVWPPYRLVAVYPKLVHFYRFHKARKREVLPSDLCLNQLQIPLTLALKSGLTHPPSLGTQGIYTKIYTVDASGIQVSKQKKNHIQINMENDQKIAHRVNCAMIKNDD